MNIIQGKTSYLMLDLQQRISLVRTLRERRQKHFEEAKRKRSYSGNRRSPKKKPTVKFSSELQSIFEGLTPEMKKLVLKG